MTAISEINKLNEKIEKMKEDKKAFTKGANEAIDRLRDELIKMYKINYQLLCLKQSVFGEIQPELIKFNEDCFHGRFLEDYRKKFENIKNEVQYFTILKGNANYLVLWLTNEQIEEYSKLFTLEFKTPANFVDYICLTNKLKSLKDVENFNYYKCDIKNIKKVISAINVKENDFVAEEDDF